MAARGRANWTKTSEMAVSGGRSPAASPGNWPKSYRTDNLFTLQEAILLREGSYFQRTFENVL